MKIKNRMKKNQGFTLLEVLISLTITGTVIAVLANALLQNNQAQHLLEERLIAAAIGQSKLAELSYGSDGGSSGDFSAPYGEKYKWYASEETLSDGNRQITLTVEWRDDRDFSHQAVLIGYSSPE